MRNQLGPLVLVATLAACGDKSTPSITTVAPQVLCANLSQDLTINGGSLKPGSVLLSSGMDMGPEFTASMVSGSGSTVTATFAANTVTPRDTPYDLVVVNKNDKRDTLVGAVTVVPGISIAAIDPGAAYAGVDFPISVFGTGFGDINKITITLAGTTTELTGVVAIDANRADAIVPKNLPAGVYDVELTSAQGCTASLAGALTIVSELTLAACSIDPPFGYDQVDSDVTIRGGSCGTDKFASTPRAWININGTLKALKNVAFVTDASLTATVPAGLTVGGPYDVLVQNPDGKVGLVAAAFTIVNQPVPNITAINPASIQSNASVTLKIFGTNFRAPVKVEAISETGTFTTVPSPTVTSATELTMTFDNQVLQLPVGAYVVRVTNTDQMTYGEFSVLAIISASGNIGSWRDVAAKLPSPTMRHGAAAGQISNAARFLYVIGGDGGGATPTRYDTTQLGTIDKFGNVGGWSVAHNHLPAARTQLQVALVDAASGAGGYLYAVGGNTAAGTDGVVLRAKILLPSEAPTITSAKVTIEGTLPRGTFYYQVSAVLDGTDAANPSGETLPSEEFAAHTVNTGKVLLSWAAVPKAASYRVYRTAMVNGTSKDEVLLAEVTTTDFVDDGSMTAGSARPFRPGEHGVWVAVEALKQPRRSHAVALAHDPSGGLHVYALGGDKATALNLLTAAADVHDTYEHAAITDGGATLSAWTEDATNKLSSKRTRLSTGVGEHATSPAVGATTAYVYAIGGWSGTATVESYQPGTVQAGGGLVFGAAEVVVGKILEDAATYVIADWLFVMGGHDQSGVAVQAAASNQYNAGATSPPVFGSTLNANSAAATDTSGTAKISTMAALVYRSSTFYQLGGTLDGTAALDRVWRNIN